jgi:glycosyltransferase involved in cell wall biosynthesis
MRILQLSPRLPFPLFDGGVISVFKVAEMTSKLGHDVTFVTYPDDDPFINAQAKEVYKDIVQLELTTKPLPSMKSVLLRTIFRGAYPIERRMMPEMFELIERLIAENTFDIVHIDHAHTGKYGLWIKERYNLPVVLREHNYETLIYERFAENEKNPLKKLVARIHAKRLRKEESRFFRGLDAVIPITLEDEILMRKEVPDASYFTIPAGVDIDYYKPQPELETENSILWIGGVNWLPNRDAVEFFVKEIFPLVVKAVPEATFDIVGDSTDKLQPLVEQWVGKIRLHGRVPDIRPFVGRATTLVCPLRVGGGMRLKLLDFFALGKAVVSTHIGAEGNLARDGEEILLRDDAASFAGGVVELLRNSQLRHKLGTNARSLALREYSWESVGKRFCTVYEKVISQRNDDNQHSDHPAR